MGWVTNRIFFIEYVHSVYMSDLATKSTIILVTGCILPHGICLNLCHMAPI
jgi:hypothetical protein